MKQLYFIKTIILPLLLLAFTPSYAQKDIDFRINLKEGMCFEVESNQLSQGSVPSGKEMIENKSESTMVSQYHVVKKKTGSYTINFMYKDCYIKSTGIRDFTVNPKTADMLNILDASTQIAMMLDKPFAAELSPKGKILAIKGNQAVMKEFKTKTKKLAPALREQVYSIVNSLTGKEALVELFENWTNYIPVSTVKIGSQWDVQKDSSITRYTFVAETDTTYVIEGVGSGKKTTRNEIQKGFVMIMSKAEEFTVTVEIDKQTFLPKVITQETEALLNVKSEFQNNPELSKPSVQSHVTTTLKIRSCH